MKTGGCTGISHAEAERNASSTYYYQYMGTLLETSHRIVSASCISRLRPSLASHVRVPPLRSSFPALLHPHYELVREQCDAWILGFVQPSSLAARRLLLDCLLPRLLCRNIPTASSLLRLVQVTKMISWLIIADDEDDLPVALGADATATAQRGGTVMAILRSHQDAHVSHEDSNVCTSVPDIKQARALEALAKLWEEMHMEMPPNLCARFISTMADYLDATEVQAAYRKAHHLPDTTAYMELRRQASFLLPAFSLVEYAAGIELDEAVYAHPQVQEFRSAAVDYICLCNDIVSCRAEVGVGDYFNMPSIIYGSTGNNEGCPTFQDAVNMVASMVEQLDARLVSMGVSICKSLSPSLQCPSVKAYVAALGSCMSGCLAWFLETARYSNP